MIETTVKLPTKFSALLRLTVEDCKKVEAQSDKYVFDMTVWVEPGRQGGHCAVCMAGAVMMQRLKLDLDEAYQNMPAHSECIEPSVYDNPTRDKLLEINNLRTGRIMEECIYREIELSDEKEREIREIEKDIRECFDHGKGRAPWSVYLHAADDLEKLGL